MAKEVKVNTPDSMQLGRTTFKFHRDLIARTMELHQAKGEHTISGSAIAATRIEYGKEYLGAFTEMETLCQKALKRNKNAKISKEYLKGLVARLSKKSIKKTKDSVAVEENTVSA